MKGKAFSRPWGGAIGMTLDADALRLVRCNRQGRILRRESYPLPDDAGADADRLGNFLRSALSRFCSNWRSWPLWLCACTPGQQLRFLQLQQVRGQEFSDMVYWTFRKDIPFETDKTVFDYGIHGSADNGKVNVTVCTAVTEELETLLAPFSDAGISLCGVMAPSFALCAFCEKVKPQSEGSVLVLHVSEEMASVVIWESGRVTGSRIFKTGLTTAQIRSAVQSERPIEDPAFMSVVERLVEQVDRTISAHVTAYPENRFTRIIVTGPLAQLKGVQDTLQQQLGVETVGQQGVGDASTEGLWAGAYGAALSHYEETPNFLYPVRERDALRRWARLRLLLALLLGVGALALLVLHGIIKHGNAGVKEQLTAEKAQLSAYDPEVNEEILRSFVDQVVEENRLLKQMADRWHSHAVLQALDGLTPSTVRVQQVELNMERTARRGPTLRVHGFSAGAPAQQLPVLAAYVLDLEQHALFRETTLRQVIEAEENNRRVLQFEVEVELAPLAGGGGSESEREGS